MLIGAFSFIMVFAHANTLETDLYLVEENETLSEIVEKTSSPPPNLYGEDGRLQEILRLNPQIQDPDLIEPGMKIKLTSAVAPPPAPKKSAKPAGPSPKARITLGAFYGPQIFSLNQTSDLGDAAIGAVFVENASVAAKYEKGEWGAAFRGRFYNVKYEVNQETTDRPLKELRFDLSHKQLFLRIALEESPLFKNAGNEVDQTAERALLPSIGAEFNWRFFGGLTLDVAVSGGIYSQGSAVNKDVKIKNASGYVADIDSNLTKELHKTKGASFALVWKNRAQHKNYTRDVEWGGSAREAETELSSFSSMAGVQVLF